MDTRSVCRASASSEAAHSQDGRSRKRRALPSPTGALSGAAASGAPLVAAGAAAANTTLTRLPTGGDADSQALHSGPRARTLSEPGTSAPSARLGAYGDLDELIQLATVRDFCLWLRCDCYARVRTNEQQESTSCQRLDEHRMKKPAYPVEAASCHSQLSIFWTKDASVGFLHFLVSVHMAFAKASMLNVTLYH